MFVLLQTERPDHSVGITIMPIRASFAKGGDGRHYIEGSLGRARKGEFAGSSEGRTSKIVLINPSKPSMPPAPGYVRHAGWAMSRRGPFLRVPASRAATTAGLTVHPV